jgi:hypothetical protein
VISIIAIKYASSEFIILTVVYKLIWVDRSRRRVIPLFNDRSKIFSFCDPYDILSPVIEGYKATLLRVTGNMPGRNVEFTVIYVPDDLVLIEEIDTPLGLGRVVVNVGDCLE